MAFGSRLPVLDAADLDAAGQRLRTADAADLRRTARGRGDYPRGSLAESLRFYGITHVAVLAADAGARGEAFNAAALANSQDFEPVVARGGDALYRVRAAPAAR